MPSSDTTALMADSYDWPTDSQSYILQGKIGRGAFATVWKAIPKRDAEGVSAVEAVPVPACAIKILNLDHVDSDLQEIRREVQALKLSLHANVLQCYTAFLQGMHLWLVTTLMRKGSSLHCLQTARKAIDCPVKQQMEPHILYILQQSLTGLQYIHENQQIHRDVKGGNVLIDTTGTVKIADFGVSQWLDYGTNTNQKARTFVGTPCWMAPEVMEQHTDGYDQKADVWSLGITALELAKGFAPYAKYPPMKVLILTLQEDPPSLETYLTLEEDPDSEDEHQQQQRPNAHAPHPHVTRSGQPIIVEQYSKLFSNLVEQCLQKNPTRRPTCRDLLQTHKALSPMTLDPAYLQQCQANLRDLVCAYVPDVGETAAASAAAANQQNQQQQRHLNNKSNEQVRIVMEQSTEQNRPKGTTWVFSDGSQVLSSTALGGDMSVDDVMDQLEDFGMESGGEHYSSSGGHHHHQQQQQQQQPAVPAHHQQQHHQRGEEDDMDDFLNSLEQTLPGEDYQRTTSSDGTNNNPS